MKKEEKIVLLINALQEVTENYFCDCGCCDSIIEEFSNKLLSIYNIEELDEKTLEDICKLGYNDIFTSYLFIKQYKDNKVRKKIADYIQNNCYYHIDYSLVEKYISNNSKLFNYLKEEDRQEKIHKQFPYDPRMQLLLRYNGRCRNRGNKDRRS